MTDETTHSQPEPQTRASDSGSARDARRPQPMIYTVRCTFPRPELRAEWIAWVVDGHAQEVVAAGATSADVVVLEEPPLSADARYTFPSREAFDAYVAEDAPRLRGEGLARFPPELGLRYARSLGLLRVLHGRDATRC